MFKDACGYIVSIWIIRIFSLFWDHIISNLNSICYLSSLLTYNTFTSPWNEDMDIGEAIILPATSDDGSGSCSWLFSHVSLIPFILSSGTAGLVGRALGWLVISWLTFLICPRIQRKLSCQVQSVTSTSVFSTSHVSLVSWGKLRT